ncbi:MAG: hypothetical protein M1833_001950 [Piccolia ochrophora]|nr:MAG: hypothetical protein M1833_001950 [Piccolia ochrophora]
MPRKGHASHGAAQSTKQPKPREDADDSFIVFTRAKDGDKDSEGPKPGSSSKIRQQNDKGEDDSLDGGTKPKPPDTRSLIGGSSWTGKLPLNMLAEHCQKQKWGKPEYTMMKTPDGFSSAVILKSTNPKTKEPVLLPPLKLPQEYKNLAVQPTAVEARHFAATYALFRVCSMRNVHMMLPPTHRDLWKGPFQELKAADVRNGQGWMYEADPFAAKLLRDESNGAQSNASRVKGVSHSKKSTSAPALSHSPLRPDAPAMKGWSNVPQIDMGKRRRLEIEELIRKYGLWNPHSHEMSGRQREGVVADLVKLGFRKSHVEEAATECEDREEALEWLLINVPEDDLPQWSLPEGYVAGVSLASGDPKREAAIKRLSSPGYSTDLCIKEFDRNGYDEAKTAEALQELLLQHFRLTSEVDGLKINADQINGTSKRQSSNLDAWKEEQEMLAAIYAERYELLSGDVCRINLEVRERPGIITLQVRRPPSRPYPDVVPILSIHSEPRLPAYIRLSIVRKVVDHAQSSFLGEQMIYLLVDWLEAEIAGVIEAPCKLRDLAVATSSTPDAETLALPRPLPRRRNMKYTNSAAAMNTSMRLLADMSTRQEMPAWQKMLAGRQSLPAWALKEDVVDMVNTHSVTIISGETGSGKSTQAVQFILDDMIQRRLGATANLVCTQPRRISALGLAQRVSEERCQAVGREVGYSIRGESRQTPGTTKITFVTTGVLLRRLQSVEGNSDDLVGALTDVSHVFVDEVHERSLDTDFLLALLKDVLRRRKDLKVVLMSATLDGDVFERYFQDVGKVGRVEIQGRTFPIQDYYLDDVVQMTGFQSSRGRPHAAGRDGVSVDEDGKSSVAGAIQKIGARINYDLIAETVVAIDDGLGAKSGGILIFLPGTMEISRTIEAVRAIPHIHALPLHASLRPDEQRRVFAPAPSGKRKVIAATNVAETSITIEDVVAVIDSGRVKETRFDPYANMVKLEEVWASLAACKQRRGRAGRVRAGMCYKLYTRNAELTKMEPRPEPEIKRVPLEQLCLSVKAMGIADVSAFLASALTPPDSIAVEGALHLLNRMGALQNTEMTGLGRHLALIPADLRCGKLMVYGATFGCFEACLSIAAIQTARSPFLAPSHKRDEAKAARSSFANGQGDLIADLRAFEEWHQMQRSYGQRNVRAWCEDKFLSHQTLNDISSGRAQYLSSLKESGFLPIEYDPYNEASQGRYNSHNTNDTLLRALIAGAFSPQIARIQLPEKKYAASVSGAIELDPEARAIKYFAQDTGRVFVHPSSTLFDTQGFSGTIDFMSYFSKMATSKVFVRDLTPFNSFTLLLFSGPITLDTHGRGLLVDGWLRLRGWARIGVLVSRLRMMLDGVLERKIANPAIDLVENDVVKVARKLVELNGMDR